MLDEGAVHVSVIRYQDHVQLIPAMDLHHLAHRGQEHSSIVPHSRHDVKTGVRSCLALPISL